MKRAAILLALMACLVATPANAAVLIPIIVAITGLSTIAASIVAAVVTAAVAVGVSYAANKYLTPEEATDGTSATGEPVGGLQLDIRADHDVPQSLIVGRAVTAGSLVYTETYGTRGEVDNSDLIQIIALADHPCDSLVKVFVEGARGTLGGETGIHGESVNGYNEKLWVRFFDGTQTTADAWTTNVLAAHSKRSWTSSFKGRGRCYARIHAIYDQDKVPGLFAWRFVVRGAKLYDPRLDTTVGGSGSHRFSDLSTHAWTDNLAVICYNILRGIRITDGSSNVVHFYGLEGLDASNLPLDTWFAAMNVCDTQIDGEDQYFGGAEIPVDTPPLEAIKEILKSCDGRLVEVGGIYKLYVGDPGAQVMSITDGSLRADSSDVFEPILPIAQRINYVAATYTGTTKWLPRVANPKRDAIAEELDGRRIALELDIPWVQSARQAQQLCRQILQKAQRQRKHRIPLGPDNWGLEPGDVIEWNSDRNGYVDKLFVVDAVEDYHDLSLVASITETDPSDYSWTQASDFETEDTDSDLEVDLPLAKAAPGANQSPGFGIIVSTSTILGDLSTLRPAITLSWDDPQDGDIVGAVSQYKLANASPTTDVLEATTDNPTDNALRITSGLQPLTDYLVRTRFLSQHGYPTDWTDWQLIQTPDSRIVHAELSVGIQSQLDDVDANSAAIIQLQTDVAALESGETFASASLFFSVFAQTAFGSASAQMRFEAQSAPTGAQARIALKAITNASPTDFADSFAAMYMDVYPTFSAITFEADRFQIFTPTGGVPVFDLTGSQISINTNVQINGNLVVTGTIDADRLISRTVTQSFATSGSLPNILGAGSVFTDDNANILVDSRTNSLFMVGSFSARGRVKSTQSVNRKVTLTIDLIPGGITLFTKTFSLRPNSSKAKVILSAPITVGRIAPPNGNYDIRVKVVGAASTDVTNIKYNYYVMAPRA